MIKYVTDTMALVLYLERRRMGAAAHDAFERADRGEGVVIHIPAMVLAEILYLSERKRIAATVGDVATLLHDVRSIVSNGGFWVAPLDLAVIERAAQITDIPELHDRLIAATAAEREAPLLTNDPEIVTSASVQTLW